MAPKVQLDRSEPVATPTLFRCPGQKKGPQNPRASGRKTSGSSSQACPRSGYTEEGTGHCAIRGNAPHASRVLSTHFPTGQLWG